VLIPVVFVGKIQVTPNPIIDGRKRHRPILEQRHRPGIVFHRVTGELRSGRFVVFIEVFDCFDAVESGCGLMGGKNRVLASETCFLQYRVVGNSWR
jgi:hypothetical protein